MRRLKRLLGLVITILRLIDELDQDGGDKDGDR